MGGSLTEVDPVLLYMSAVTVVAVAIQTAIGFGAMLVCMTFGSFFLTVPELTALLLPLTTVQASVVLARHWQDVHHRLLLWRVLPWMGLGIGLGVVLVGGEAQPWMRPALGAMILTLALRELWLAWASRSTPQEDNGAPGSRVASTAALVGAGVVHAVFATGGPPLVWALGKEGLSKGSFRTTLTAVWVLVNAGLLTVFVARGTLTVASLQRTAWLLVPTLIGLGVGEILHNRVKESTFRLSVWVLLALAALPLLAR